VSKTFEEDLVELFAGKLAVHNGRWDRGAMVAKGTYLYRDKENRECGNEVWELFTAVEGGYFLHSRIAIVGLSTDVFERIDAKGRPAFADITKALGDDRTRLHITVDGETLTARMRGSTSGVVTQTLEVPDDFFLSTPSVASQGWTGQGDASRRRAIGYV